MVETPKWFRLPLLLVLLGFGIILPRVTIASELSVVRQPGAVTQKVSERSTSLAKTPWSSRKKQSAADADLGRPPSRSGGQGRNGCLKSPVALVPGQGEVLIGADCGTMGTGQQQAVSLAEVDYTLEENPVFWLYVPSYDQPNLQAELVLIDNRSKVDSWMVQLPKRAGATCFQLPLALETENIYKWIFEVKLNPKRSSKNPRVGGLIERQSAKVGERSWSDQVTQVGQQLQTGDDAKLAQVWADLLAEQGLGAIANQPIHDQCLAVEASVENP